jgi:chaperonin GroEL (HSP60 family)
MKTIASNAGVEGAVIIGKVEEQEDPSTGYNAATGERPATWQMNAAWSSILGIWAV